MAGVEGQGKIQLGDQYGRYLLICLSNLLSRWYRLLPPGRSGARQPGRHTSDTGALASTGTGGRARRAAGTRTPCFVFLRLVFGSFPSVASAGLRLQCRWPGVKFALHETAAYLHVRRARTLPPDTGAVPIGLTTR
ncbi:hypothetical protein KGQ19_48785, partial [Catenulispora sp. NL8]